MAGAFGTGALMLLPVLLLGDTAWLSAGAASRSRCTSARPDRARLRALRAWPARGLGRRDRHAHPRRAAHGGPARRRRARRAPRRRSRRWSGAGARRPALLALRRTLPPRRRSRRPRDRRPRRCPAYGRECGDAPRARQLNASRPSTPSGSLRVRILEGDLAPGERLAEKDLTDDLRRRAPLVARRAARARGRRPGPDRAPSRRQRGDARPPRRSSACSSCAPRSRSRRPGWRWSARADASRRVPRGGRRAARRLRRAAARPGSRSRRPTARCTRDRRAPRAASASPARTRRSTASCAFPRPAAARTGAWRAWRRTTGGCSPISSARGPGGPARAPARRQGAIFPC